MTKLTVKQQKFVDEYIKTGNATQAAINAGYSKKSAHTAGRDNIKNKKEDKVWTTPTSTKTQ